MATRVKGDAILFSEMTPPDGGEDAFNDWYDNHHTPSHVQGVPGFLSAMRYKAPAGPHYLAVYELDSPAALASEEYRSRKFTPDEETRRMLEAVSGFTRYIGSESFCAAGEGGDAANALDAPVLLCEFLTVPIEAMPEFATWFDGEHAPMLLGAPGWLMARRFDVVEWDPESYTQMMLHYLADEGALRSEERKRAAMTDRRAALARESWFRPHRVTYHRRGVRFHSKGPKA